MTPDGKFLFKATYKLKDRKSLLKLLKQQDLKGSGGVYYEEVMESLPHAEKALKVKLLNSLFVKQGNNFECFFQTLLGQNEIQIVQRPTDKKKVLFYNDRMASLTVDEEFQKLWRSVAVDAMDDAKINEYLEKQGIRSMQDHGLKKPLAPRRKKAAQRKRQFKKPRDNEHLVDVLEVYEEGTLTQKQQFSSSTKQ